MMAAVGGCFLQPFLQKKKKKTSEARRMRWLPHSTDKIVLRDLCTTTLPVLVCKKRQGEVPAVVEAAGVPIFQSIAPWAGEPRPALAPTPLAKSPAAARRGRSKWSWGSAKRENIDLRDDSTKEKEKKRETAQNREIGKRSYVRKGDC